MVKLIKCLIITPLFLESEAVRLNLFDCQKIMNFPCYALRGTFNGKVHKFDITLIQTGAKNTEVAIYTEKAIQLFKPNMVLLVGIAGGIKDLNLLDVAVGNKAYGYESGKITDEGFFSRPEVYEHSKDLIKLASSIINTSNWKKRSPYAQDNKAIIGAICSGNKVVASTNSDVYKNIKHHYNDCIALEMEAIGFTKIMEFYPLILHLNIRGISDLLEGKSKSDKEGNQHKAVANASAFVFELLNEFDYSQITIPKQMELNTIAATIFDNLEPFLKKSTSVKKITSEIVEATDTTLKSIWDKVKPIFIEEFKETPNQLSQKATNKALAEHFIEKELQQNELLKKELEILLARYNNEKQESSMIIQNSKNVIQGNEISNSKVTIGDKTIYNTGQKIINNGNIEKQVNIKKNKGDINL